MSPERGAAERWTARGLVLFAVWLGLSVGVIETAALLAQRVLGHAIIHRPRELVWMAPLGYAVIFTVLGLAAASFVRVVRARWPAPVMLFLLLLTALGLLAAGVAARLTPIVFRRPAATRRLAARSVPLLAGLVAIAGIAAGASRARAERVALDAMPPAPDGAPNVLLLILDTVAATHTSAHGYERPTTPVLERLASEGVAFDGALSTAPWTLPSHASMFTGRYPYELPASWLVPLGSEPPTLAERLRDRGWATAGFVANRQYTTYEHGLNRGFVRYEDYRISPGQIARSTVLGRYIADSRRLRGWIGDDRELGRKDARRLADSFLGWLDGAPSRPFFAFLNFYDAHDPYLPPDEYFARFAGHPRGGMESPFRRHAAGRLARDLSPEELRLEMDAYDGAISYIDAQIGRLLDGLRERGVLDRTLVIVTADHGEEFGEHGVFLHGHSLYLPSLHVPLVIRYPARVPAGRRVEEPVTLRDLAATVADLAGACDAGFPGRSLAVQWGDPGCADGVGASPLLASVRRGVRVPAAYPTARGDMYSTFDAQRRYILNGDGVEEVYRWEEDPLETVNLAETPEGRAAIEELSRLLPAGARPAGTGGAP